MNFSSEKKNDINIEKVNLKRGTHSEADEFKTILLNEIKSGVLKIIIDLNKCEFIDSVFLGTIIFIYKNLTASKGELKLIASHPDVKILLEITGANKFIEVYQTRKEAIKSFQKIPDLKI